ncbi:MAG: pyruvate formate lyase family protein [Eubacteriales bacterium]|nr:pyruvate formate lyase family protein [Eubacteriales bacterium]
MIFYGAGSVPRPIRLSQKTRRFAYESLQGKYGDDTVTNDTVINDTVINDAVINDAVHMDGYPDFEKLGDYDKYDAAINEIAHKAPVRICDGELLSGAATLGMAIYHRVPAKYKGEALFWSVSHLTLDFAKVLRMGINGIEKEAVQSLARPGRTDDEKRVLQSILNTVSAFRVWHGRYLNAVKDKLPENYVNLLRVPFEPPVTFHQAMQSLWFTFAFVRLCGNWPGIGRIDEMVGGLLESDLKNGVITTDKAREIVAHFFIKGCEWIRSSPCPSSGDAQHYQNLVLGGTDINGNDITNTMSYLVLETAEELPIGDFPITVRQNAKTPHKFKEKAAEVIRHGGGVVAVYNESVVYEALYKLGYPKEEAVNFANDGCWEVQIPGKTWFTYQSFDGLRLLLDDTLHIGEPNYPVYASYDELYTNYVNLLNKHIGQIWEEQKNSVFDKDGNFSEECPCSAVSMLEEGCIDSGRSYLGGGAVYTVRSPHFGGMADVVNSLYAIKTAVFEKKLIGYDDLMTSLGANWEGYETLRQYMRNRLTYYGNDSDNADSIYVSLINDFAKICGVYNRNSPFIFTAGVSTFGRQIEWKDIRKATPFGSERGAILAPNASPTPGTDTAGVTAMIRSHCKADLTLLGTGAALDLALHPSAVEGESGKKALISLFDGFCELGGFFMQADVVDVKVLRDAQAHPENYKSLSVRVSGWNARFVTLDSEWQRMIMEKSENRL